MLHALPNLIPFTAIMTRMFRNSVDFPAGVVTAYQEKGFVEAEVKKGCKGRIGHPLSVHIVAPPFRDESVLRAMCDLYDAMKEGMKTEVRTRWLKDPIGQDTLQKLIASDLKDNGGKLGIATEGLLWLKRGQEFMLLMLIFMVRDYRKDKASTESLVSYSKWPTMADPVVEDQSSSSQDEVLQIKTLTKKQIQVLYRLLILIVDNFGGGRKDLFGCEGGRREGTSTAEGRKEEREGGGWKERGVEECEEKRLEGPMGGEEKKDTHSIMSNQVYNTVATLVSLKTTKYSVLGLITLYLLKKLKERSRRNKIQSLYALRIEAAQRERDEIIEWARKESKLVKDEERIRIESMNFMQLRDALQSGEVTAESVIRVYFGLAIEAHEKTNCLTNIIKESLKDAREMDKKAKDPSFKKPPLFGLAISIKEANELAGHRNTWGLAKLVDNYPSEDSYNIMKLRQDGMIPFCQTNVPTTCMTYMTSNSIYGTTTNPHNSSRTCGGSSGGEGALIGFHGSLIGMGSDIGGSIRIPSSYSGCCGFKPSSTRFSTLQLKEPVPMRPINMPTEGPLAQDPHAIVAIMRSIWSDQFMSNADPFSVPIDFREDLFKEEKKYRIGYYTTDGYIDPLPGNQRVVNEAAELLRKKGHELVPFSMEDIVSEMARGMFSTISSDGGERQVKLLEDEPLCHLMSPLRNYAEMPLWRKKLIGWYCKIVGDKTSADAMFVQSKRASDMQDAIDKVYATRKRLVKGGIS
ncbi:hypothetical protein PRIPAC_80354 [Pristionchus pacificus]|uniref:Amidase n=1 Tax=Pristionchus pacificus TaxID=54126 RepID=A0A2A6C240_PRIPA|nr:hypothetical protein PRIPAC_80354 [Pristionchus pacificus]|eukprot:PDM72093.1 amidase [Pristionchus pacificus]